MRQRRWSGAMPATATHPSTWRRTLTTEPDLAELGVPDDMIPALTAGLARDPSQRPTSAGEFAQLLSGEITATGADSASTDDRPTDPRGDRSARPLTGSVPGGRIEEVRRVRPPPDVRYREGQDHPVRCPRRSQHLVQEDVSPSWVCSAEIQDIRGNG